MERTKHNLAQQMRRRITNRNEPSASSSSVTSSYQGNVETIVSTGSTLLDLAISGGRIHGGGIPGGILVEIFGPSGAGKTVLLCEIAGACQRSGGKIKFLDPEARLNKQFAKIFNLDLKEEDYATPDTVPEVFQEVRDWSPTGEGINGVFADSLAALSTQWEAEGKDQYGMRRAKEFSEQCRLTCRGLSKKNILMVCSNQIRQNLDAGPYGQKYKSPGGEALGFYSSLRLRCLSGKKIIKKKNIKGKEHTRVLGIETEVEVYKSSIWKPYRKASIFIIFDYGIDDIRGNLQFLKTLQGTPQYEWNGKKLGRSIDEAIKTIEIDKREEELRQTVIETWLELEKKFETDRKRKR